MQDKGTLYLIPTPLSENTLERVLPNFNISIIKNISYFIVEEIKTARRFLKACDSTISIDALTFYELNEHTRDGNIAPFLDAALKGHDVGVISEAGCPAIADPGAEIVKIAHQKGITVCPLVGPSSIFLALMASGLNGQNFAFNGYLPFKEALPKSLKQLEQLSKARNQTQIFIETPYRNQKLLEEIVQTCMAETMLCVAVDINSKEEFIRTKPIREWKGSLPNINKKPAIFLLHNY